MRHLLVAVSLMFLAPAAVLAQMGPEMMMGGMGGMAASPMDIDPLWSPDGKHIAFTRISGQGSPEAGIIQVGVAGDEPKMINNLKPLAWTPDSSGLLCGLSGGQQGSPYAGFWLVDRARPNRITLVARGNDPKQAEYSPDGRKLLLVDEVAGKRHELLVGDVGDTPALFYSTRGNDKVISAGWNDKSDAIWVLLEVAGKDALEPGAELPKEALRRQAMGGMMGGGMMPGGMMGPEGGMMGGMMPGGMMGPEGGMMGMGGMAPAQPKKFLFLLALDGSKTQKIGEEIEAVSWNPKQPLIAMRRKVTTKAAGGMMPGGMMGPEGGMMPGGMMGPEGGMMGGMMGGMTQTEEYMAVRNPAEAPDTEERFGYPGIPIEGLGWSPDGKMISGANVKEKRIFAVKSPSGPIYEVAQNFDDSVKDPSPKVLAWSPDAKKIVFPAATNVRENNEQFVIKGLVIRDLEGAPPVQLTATKTRAMMGGMMGGGMMGPEGMMMMPGG